MLKRIISLAITVTMAAGCITAYADSNKGDLNNDGRLNVTDVSKLAAHVKGVKSLSGTSLTRADVNSDGKVNVTDISMLANHVKGGGDSSASKTPTADDYALQLAKLVNNERRARGLTPYVYSTELNKAAMIRAKELYTKFDHPRPDGRSCFSIYDDLGINWTAVAENIAYGQSSAQAAFNDFMSSEHHRSSMLDATKTYMGIGVYRSSSGTLYWAQLFANGSGMTGSVV